MNSILSHLVSLRQSLGDIRAETKAVNTRLDACYESIDHLPLNFESMETEHVLCAVFAKLGIKAASGSSIGSVISFADGDYSRDKQQAAFLDILQGIRDWGTNYTGDPRV